MIYFREYKKNQIIRCRKINKLKDYLLKSPNVDSLDEGEMIILESQEDLELLTQYLFKCDNNTDLNLIRLKMSWFIGCINNQLYIHSFSNCYNHSDNDYCIKYNFDEEGILKQIAIRDIEKDSELFINYNIFSFPTFYIDWCKKYNLSTVIENIV